MGQITYAMFISLLTLPGRDRDGMEQQRGKPKLAVSPLRTPAPHKTYNSWFEDSILEFTVDSFQSQDPLGHVFPLMFMEGVWPTSLCHKLSLFLYSFIYLLRQVFIM